MRVMVGRSRFSVRAGADAIGAAARLTAIRIEARMRSCMTLIVASALRRKNLSVSRGFRLQAEEDAVQARYDSSMRYRTFGATGCEVSEVGYGMWGMAGWTGSDDEE